MLCNPSTEGNVKGTLHVRRSRDSTREIGAVASNDPMEKARQAQQHCLECERELVRAREQLYEAIGQAVDAGFTLSALGRELGMTRQNVQRLQRRRKRRPKP